MLKCGCCGYENPYNKWTKISLHSSDGYSGLICYKYDMTSDKRNHIGSVDLFACPVCNMITWKR